ncbi:MAG: hypothetical protein HOP15_14915 [Planctomycetes bacterium]|nr:hypothetical protein [Planctomycetota bacterium]
MKKKIEEEIDPEQEEERKKHLAELEQHIAELEAEISTRPEWLFADAQDRWWHNQLEKLVSSVKTFSNPETGLASGGTSAEHGWGIQRRFEFARTIAERSVSGAEASGVGRSRCQSRGRRRMPAVRRAAHYSSARAAPIGRDLESGLLEFAHLQTGEPAERGPDGKLT